MFRYTIGSKTRQKTCKQYLLHTASGTDVSPLLSILTQTSRNKCCLVSTPPFLYPFSDNAQNTLLQNACPLPSNSVSLLPVSSNRLVGEAAVRVLAEQRQTHRGQSIGLEQLKALLERVVDFDLARAVKNDNTTGAAKCQSVKELLSAKAANICHQGGNGAKLTTPPAARPSHQPQPRPRAPSASRCTPSSHPQQPS